MYVRLRARGALVLVLPLAFAALGCGPDNVSACTSYVTAANAARVQCGVTPPLDVEVMCPASLNHGADCTDHYGQLAQSVNCDGGLGGTVRVENGTGRTEGCF